MLPLARAPRAIVRLMSLNCLTAHYAKLWNDTFDMAFTDESWSQPDIPACRRSFSPGSLGNGLATAHCEPTTLAGWRS